MKVLVVDDEDLLVEFLRRSLKADNHVVEIARNGQDAVTKAISRNYDVILLDVIMPIKDGVQVCKELREQQIETPILILSSRDSETARVQGLDAGADDYLIKPFGYKELSARLRALQRRPRHVDQPLLRVKNIELDPARRIVSVSGRDIDMRPKEFSLLEYLMRHAGTAVSRYEILEKVWGVSAFNTSNRLDVCIKQVREKIGDNVANGPHIIKTVHGFGYRIEL